MSNFLGKSLVTALTIVFANSVFASNTSRALVMAVDDEIVKEIRIEKVAEENFKMPTTMGWESDCTLLDKKPNVNPNSVEDGNIDINDIVNLGKKIWQVVKDNEPILEARGVTASALPRGVECWNQLTNWAPTRAETYRVTYKNGWGMNVVDLSFRLVYSYGGQLHGKGQFLTNSTIQYNNIDVLWGYVFNADVEIPQVLNMGSEDAPVGGMQLTLNWSVKTRPVSLKKSVSSMSFFVGGDGRATKILQ